MLKNILKIFTVFVFIFVLLSQPANACSLRHEKFCRTKLRHHDCCRQRFDRDDRQSFLVNGSFVVVLDDVRRDHFCDDFSFRKPIGHFDRR